MFLYYYFVILILIQPLHSQPDHKAIPMLAFFILPLSITRASSLPIVPQPMSPTFLNNLLSYRSIRYYDIKLPGNYSAR